MAHNGERIGWVTSCAIDAERFLTGQAYLENGYTKVDTAIGIHQGGNTDHHVPPAWQICEFQRGGLLVGCVVECMSFVEAKAAGQPGTGTCDMMKQDKSIRYCS